MLSLKKLAKLSGVEEKGIFPYKILNKNLKDEVKIEKEMFNDVNEYEKFKERYGSNIKVYEILEEYCINDARITKESIIKY
jgi:formylmethanofuran dehydrogenase subunit A